MLTRHLSHSSYLRYLSQFYEIVLFTTQPAMVSSLAPPICRIQAKSSLADLF
jgi:hypothetical protein